MKTIPSFKLFFTAIMLLSIIGISSCKKNDNLVAFTGNVVNAENKIVSAASIEVYRTAEDWLTGHNVVAKMTTDAGGYFESAAIYEPGDYFIFIEKYDTSNWEIRAVEQGNYPIINAPEDKGKTHIIDYNNMSVMASTSWVLSNVHKEYTKPGATATEWQSIWTSINNCRRDNELVFNKDMSLRISEGNYVCRNKERNIIGTFIPPIIFSQNSCEDLPNTATAVKEFEYSGWPEMEARNAKMYFACNPSIGQVFILFEDGNGLKNLEVYSRQ